MDTQIAWTGLVTRGYAEYVMGAASVAGGFIAVGLPDQDEDTGRTLYPAVIPATWSPPSPAEGRRVSPAELRRIICRLNGYCYLGHGEDDADEHGFATNARVANLLARIPTVEG